MLTTVFMIITATLQKNNFLITQIGVDKFVYPFFVCVIYIIIHQDIITTVCILFSELTS